MGKDQDLLDACRTGNVHAVDKLLAGRLNAKRGSKASIGGGASVVSTISKSFLNLKSANVNCADGSGETPLHLAALNGHKEIVSMLLECEALPTILDTQDCSPLHLAAWNGHTEICSMLLQTTSGQSLINLQTREGNTALHFAAQHGHTVTLLLLLQKQADPTIRNLEDLSPVDLAAQYDRLDIVKQLITSHPELVVQRSLTNTPLHLASRNGHKGVVQFLLDSGFNIDAKTDKGTALHEAANFCKLDVIKLLLERGIDITVKSHTDCTAEDILRSIPSKAAEDALNILKSHIYHQRTPDSDGERAIVAEASLAMPSIVTTSTAPDTQQKPKVLPPPTSSVPTVADKKPTLITSLPQNADLMVPPPIPPRQSVVRATDRSDNTSESSLTPIRMPSDREISSDEDKTKLNASPRDVSPSARSPSDLPKKPPRKKPLSFRRTDQGHPLTVAEGAGGNNYVNFDPEVERALIVAKLTQATKDSDISVVPCKEPEQKKQFCDKPAHGVETHHTTPNITAVAQEDTTSAIKQSDDILDPHPDVVDKKTESCTKPPSSLDIQQSEAAESVPRSPTHHKQPPTPDCPPPSPGTALQNIHRKIQPMEKRKSRDMETTTDNDLIGHSDSGPQIEPLQAQDVLTPVNEEATPTSRGNQSVKRKPEPLPRKSSVTSDTRDLVKSSQNSPQLVEGSKPGDLHGYSSGGGGPDGTAAPLLRASSLRGDGDGQERPGSTSSVVLSACEDGTCYVGIGQDVVHMRRSISSEREPSNWEGHAFEGLLRGSVIGPARDVVHQMSANNALWKKRKSTLSTFAPVMEEDKDIDLEKTFNAIDNIQVPHDVAGKKSDEDVFDDDEDWAKINATFAEFGVGIGRESVFVREHEGKFKHFLTSGKKGESKIQSVGEWLSDIGLPQYENTLVANGFDDTDFLGSNILDDHDLRAIGVDDPTHRKTILSASDMLPALQPIDSNNVPQTVAEWLGSLRLDYYFDTFMSHKYDSMDRVVKIWELELVSVLDISSIGHRKRILASLGERKFCISSSPARTRFPSLDSLNEPKSPFDHVDLYKDYTGVKSKVSESSDYEQPLGSPLDFNSSSPFSPGPGKAIRDSSIHVRPPHLMHYTGAIKQWRHKPETLIKGCCNYTAHYLGSTLVRELNGPMSTQEGITKLKKSSEVISKIPSIMLSISFKGVKFIDAVSKKVVCDHEIANIFCACQDGEHMNFFAYITKDRENGKNYCHVFSVRSRDLAGEIILTLGEAFEIAYQMALKERAEQEALEFDKLSTSDDAASISSSQTCVNTF